MTDHHAIQRLAHSVAPDLVIVSTSNPEPVLQRYTVVALFDATDAARKAVVALEGLERDDASIGLTVLGDDQPGAVPDEREKVDPEGVARDVMPRVVLGAIIGAVVGAVLVGLVAGLIAGASAAVGGAIGGLLLGAPIGAVWGAFVRMGGSDAYRQTFVAPNRRDVTLVSLHTNDEDEAAAAFDRLAAAESRDVVVLDGDGRATRVPGR